MSNMSYCRFRNTLTDLQDCRDSLDDNLENSNEWIARRQLIALCIQIADEYREELEEDGK